MTTQELSELLSPIIQVSSDPTDLKRFATDASIFEITPALVVFPQTKDELKALVKLVTEKAGESDALSPITLSPRAGGTCMSGGSLTEGVVIDMTRSFNQIGPIDTEAKTVWVEAGTYYRDLEAAADVYSLVFAPYTSSKNICTIGGMLGNNASGEKSIRYGATVDNTLAVRMICVDGNEYEFGELTETELEEKKGLETFEGEIYRELSKLISDHWQEIASARPQVPKNAAGYGLWSVWDPVKKTFNIAKLIVGSQGTLGIITEANLKLVAKPLHARMVVLSMSSLVGLAEGVALMRSFGPEGMETFDGNTHAYAKKHLPDITALTPDADGKTIILFGQFSEMTAEATDAKARDCADALTQSGFDAKYISEDREREAYWTIRRQSYKLLKDHAEHVRAVPLIEDTIVPLEHFSEYVAGFGRILTDMNIHYGFHGHIGDGSLRIIPLVNMEDTKAVETIFSIAEQVYDLAVSLHGSISVDHNDGIVRTPFLHKMFSPQILALFQQTKTIFDPHTIFNPGKKVHGDLAYAKAHMSRRNNP